MKRRFKAVVNTLVAVSLAAGMLSGCSTSKAAQSSAEVQETDGKKVLRVGMECAYAPFNWTQETAETADGGKAEPIYGTSYYAYGYDVMMARKIADELGWDLEIHKVEWDSIGMGLDSKEYDCIIAGMGKTAEREKAYDFTEAYYFRDICITVKKGSQFEAFTGLSDFAGTDAKLTTQLGTAWVNLLDQIPDGNPGANYATTAECFMAVSNGAADLCVIDLPTSQSAAMTNPDLMLLTLDADDTITDPTGSTNVCIAVRKGDTELKDQIQGAMDALSWNSKDQMDEMMAEAIRLQPAAN